MVTWNLGGVLNQIHIHTTAHIFVQREVTPINGLIWLVRGVIQQFVSFSPAVTIPFLRNLYYHKRTKVRPSLFFPGINPPVKTRCYFLHTCLGTEASRTHTTMNVLIFEPQVPMPISGLTWVAVALTLQSVSFSPMAKLLCRLNRLYHKRVEFYRKFIDHWNSKLIDCFSLHDEFP